MNEILSSLLPLIVLFAIFYFIMIRPQIKQQKAHKEMIANLKKGDKVVVSGGFICEILKVEDKFFTVKIDDNSNAKLVKDFIAYKYDEQDNQNK